jgi:hypothetical protein
MYFCYIDESGNDNVSPALVMVGIVLDATKLRRTQEDFGKIFATLCEVTGRPLKELKSSDLLPGKNTWHGVDGEVRRNVVSNLCDWVGTRSHKIALAALDRSLHKGSTPGCRELEDEWQAAATHLLLQLQRHGASKDRGKGRTVVVIDNNPRGLALLSDLVDNPPSWTDEYYGRVKKEPPLSQIIDTPFAVQSHHVGMIQVADVFAGILRHYSELEDYGWPEKFTGERAQYSEWAHLLKPSLLGNAHRWGKGNKSEAAQWYRSLAPASLVALG